MVTTNDEASAIIAIFSSIDRDSRNLPGHAIFLRESPQSCHASPFELDSLTDEYRYTHVQVVFFKKAYSQKFASHARIQVP
jgi:hypothetical protein